VGCGPDYFGISNFSRDVWGWKIRALAHISQGIECFLGTPISRLAFILQAKNANREIGVPRFAPDAISKMNSIPFMLCDGLPRLPSNRDVAEAQNHMSAGGKSPKTHLWAETGK